MAGVVVRLKGLKRYSSKGVDYVYHRTSGIRLCPPHAFGTPEFMAAYAAAEAAVEKAQSKVRIAGTFGQAVDAYLDSATFLRLRDRTRRDYRKIADWLRALDGLPLSAIDRAFVYKLREKAFKVGKRRFANYVLSVFSVIIEHAINAGLGIKQNPAKDMPKIRKPTDEPEANVAWLDEEFQAVISAAPPRLAGPIAMAWYLGLRQGDVLKVGRAAIRDGILHHRASKNGQQLQLPMPAPLLAILATMPAHDAMTLFATTEGVPWEENAFRTALRRLMLPLKDAGAIRRELTFHGLRTTFAQRADATGVDHRKIANAMGHKDVKTTEGYIRQANVARDQALVIDLMTGSKKRRR